MCFINGLKKVCCLTGYMYIPSEGPVLSLVLCLFFVCLGCCLFVLCWVLWDGVFGVVVCFCFVF